MNYLGIDKEKLSRVVKNLNFLLADYQIYYQNLRNYHWNIEGENFFDLHQRFEDLYNDAKIKIDEIAERVLTLLCISAKVCHPFRSKLCHRCDEYN